VVSQEAVASLKQLGLTEYEARVFWGLATLGAGNPREVATTAGIPYPSAYDTLRSLLSKGWVEIAASKPAIYTIRSPALLRREVQYKIDKTFQELQEVFKTSREAVPQVVYTIRGREKVLAKIAEMLDSAQKFVFVVAASALLSDATIKKWLQKLIERRITVNLITDAAYTPEIGRDYKLRFRDSVLAVDILVDGRQALIGLPDCSVCGWVESPIIAAHFQEFLELLWQKSHKSPVKNYG